MRLTSLHVEGLRAADGVDLHRPADVHDLPDGRLGTALLDALELLVAGLSPSRTVAALVRLGVASSGDEVELVEESGLPIQVSVMSGDAGAIIDPERSRSARIKATFELDPPLFGTLRQHAVRDPRLVNALSEATLTVAVGWMWTTDLTTASVGLLSIAIGGTAFPTTATERPAWLGSLLDEVAGRIRRVPLRTESELAERLHAAALSPEPETRARYARLAAALAEPPFRFGALELVRLRGEVRPCFGPDLLRARQLGPDALPALSLASTVLLDQPDILMVDGAHALRARGSDTEGVHAWLAALSSGDGAILEQSLLAAGGAG